MIGRALPQGNSAILERALQAHHEAFSRPTEKSGPEATKYPSATFVIEGSMTRENEMIGIVERARAFASEWAKSKLKGILPTPMKPKLSSSACW
jgi:hypothetical protein